MIQDPLDAKLGLEVWRLDPARFAARLDPARTFQRYPHVDLLARRFRDAALGRNPRQIWNLPPGYYKSSVASRWGPLWLLDLDPTKRIIIASYGDELALGHARFIRDTIQDLKGQITVTLSESSASAGRFDTPEGGGVLATSVHGRMIGYRADIVVVDDPHKDMPAARSVKESEGVFEWLRSVVMSRLMLREEPPPAILVLHHRLAPTDLTGRIKSDPMGTRWDHLILPAIATPTEDSPDPLGRAEGDPLCPLVISAEKLADEAIERGPYVFATMWQQKPTSAVGTLFKRTTWGKVAVAPAGSDIVRVRRWDLAATEGGGDWTVGVLMAYGPDRRPVVEDVVRDRLGPDGVKNLIHATALEDRGKYGKALWTRIEQESGGGGKSWAAELVRDTLAGFNASAVTSHGKKFDRALPYSAQQLAGNVDLLTDGQGAPLHWHEAFIHEHAEFTGRDGDTDDQVDAASLAYSDCVTYFATHSKRRVKMRTAAGQSIGGPGFGNYR